MSNILWDSEMVRVDGKGGSTERFVPIGPIARTNLKNYISKERPALIKKKSKYSRVILSRNGNKLTRMMIWILLKKWTSTAEITKEVSPHTLLHSLQPIFLKAVQILGLFKRCLVMPIYQRLKFIHTLTKSI